MIGEEWMAGFATEQEMLDYFDQQREDDRPLIELDADLIMEQDRMRQAEADAVRRGAHLTPAAETDRERRLRRDYRNREDAHDDDEG